MNGTIKIGSHYSIDKSQLPTLRSLQKSARSEKKFFQQALEKGYQVCRTGWPDYLIVKGNKIAFVEVKKDSHDHLKDNQSKILQILSNHGLDCYVWRPDTGFTKVKPKLSSALRYPALQSAPKGRNGQNADLLKQSDANKAELPTLQASQTRQLR